jgi:hypothetical protein
MSKPYRFVNHVIGNYSKQFGRRIAKAVQAEQKQAIKEIYVEERKECADRVRNDFKALCHAGWIKGKELKELRILLESCLGSYVSEYKGWKFDNEFHRLYTYLKSYHLDKGDWKRIQEYLEQIQKSS